MDKKSNSFINSRKKPLIPKGWKIVKHVKIKSFYWNRKSAVLHREKEQKKGLYVSHKVIVRRLKRRRKILLNATVLDFLMKHKNRIPQSWEGKTIDFPGTVYRDNSGELRTAYLVRHQLSHWKREFSFKKLVSFGAHNYTAILAE